MSSSGRPFILNAIDGACTPRVAEARPAHVPEGEPGPLAGRSPLADPRLGLAWSSRSVSDEVLVRAAIKHGAFHLLLEAALHHGLPFVEQQLAIILEDGDVALSDRAQAEIRRKLGNIRRGIAAAERHAQ